MIHEDPKWSQPGTEEGMWCNPLHTHLHILRNEGTWITWLHLLLNPGKARILTKNQEKSTLNPQEGT